MQTDRESRTPADRILAEAEALADADRWSEAIQVLTKANRQHQMPELESALVATRHSAFAALEIPEVDDAWPPALPDHFAGAVDLPEVDRASLTAETLGSALQHHGSLIVRGLLGSGAVADLLEVSRRAFEALSAFHDGAPAEATAPYFAPFTADDGYPFGFFEQSAARLGGGVLLAESPRALFEVTEAYRANGLVEILADYLGEWPALSVKKSTLRHARPDSMKGWHQDGRFLGSHVHTVNVWAALTPCGVDAPGIEVYTSALDHLVASGTEGANFEWSVGDGEVERYGLDHTSQPEFAAGDVLLFNQMTLHQTGIRPTMTAERYAIESWFFGPSTYPTDQVPLVV